MKNYEFIGDSYICKKCGHGISQASDPTKNIPKDNLIWLKMIDEFYENHKDHGFSL